MWLQAIAIILPRMQQQFSSSSTDFFSQVWLIDFPPLKVPDNYIGAVSSAMFAGMMVGAVGWGTCSFICLHPVLNLATDTLVVWKVPTLLVEVRLSTAHSFLPPFLACLLLFQILFQWFVLHSFSSEVRLGWARIAPMGSLWFLTLFFPGIYAYWRHTYSRERAESESESCYSALCLLLCWFSLVSCGRPSRPSWSFMSYRP